jgi:hypothetical protein
MKYSAFEHWKEVCKEVEYEKSIFNYLCGIKESETILVSDITSEDTRNKFISVMKKFINNSFDRDNNFIINFSEDFSKFHKLIL